MQKEGMNLQDSEKMFGGFTAEYVQTERGKFFLRRSAVKGSTILRLHGFPESHECWNKIAPDLSEYHLVICMDLLGCGLSDALAGGASHKRYSKLEMAKDCLAVMDHLGVDLFTVAGHDMMRGETASGS